MTIILGIVAFFYALYLLGEAVGFICEALDSYFPRKAPPSVDTPCVENTAEFWYDGDRKVYWYE